MNWAVIEGYIGETPFRRGGVAAVKLTAGVEGARTRRLEPGEGALLLAHAPAHLRALIVENGDDAHHPYRAASQSGAGHAAARA